MNRLRLKEVVVVEGKYDAAAVSGVVDSLVLTTDGFSIFSDDEAKALLRRLGKERGLVILTDSDAAGFAIRSYVQKVAGDCDIKNAYIPAVPGKESRKARPSKEGTLGVEGLPPEVLRTAFERAGVSAAAPKHGRAITYTDFYEMGLSGGAGSAARRRDFLQRLGLPPRLSKKALLEVLQSLYSYEELEDLVMGKPALFWDFHATLSMPDVTWFDAAMYAIDQVCPHKQIPRKAMEKTFDFTCLPWWECEDRDTRHVKGSKAWWAFCEGHFVSMLHRCGLDDTEARKAAPLLRPYILNPANYRLYPDATETLAALQKRGYRHYILSNNFPELEEVLRGLGLAPYFSGYVVSGQVGYEKPRPEIFETALVLAGNPAEKIMLGDNPRDDIEGGKAAGFTTVAVHGVHAPLADHSVDALSELLKLLP